jgi:hypothetical protein
VDRGGVSGNRKQRRAQLAALRLADDHYRAESARWAAGGYQGPAPEFHSGPHDTAVVVVAGTADVIFPLEKTHIEQVEALTPAPAEPEISGRELIRRTKPESQTGPPKRWRRLLGEAPVDARCANVVAKRHSQDKTSLTPDASAIAGTADFCAVKPPLTPGALGAAADAVLATLRRQRLVAQVHRLGERVFFELLDELDRRGIVSWAELEPRLERFAALDPEILQALGGDRFAAWPLHLVPDISDEEGDF